MDTMDCTDRADCLDCCVFPGRGGWMARLQAGEAGPFITRDIALRVAINDALHARHSGLSARVSVQDPDGSVRAERCLCEHVSPSEPRAA